MLSHSGSQASRGRARCAFVKMAVGEVPYLTRLRDWAIGCRSGHLAVSKLLENQMEGPARALAGPGGHRMVGSRPSGRRPLHNVLSVCAATSLLAVTDRTRRRHHGRTSDVQPADPRFPRLATPRHPEECGQPFVRTAKPSLPSAVAARRGRSVREFRCLEVALRSGSRRLNLGRVRVRPMRSVGSQTVMFRQARTDSG